MKKIVLLLLFAPLLWVGCEKEDPKPTPIKPDRPSVPAPILIPDAVTDFDGNHYDAVQIGDQVWMAQNLRTTHYAHGEGMMHDHLSSNAHRIYYYPNDNEDDVETYGLLYNWVAAVCGISLDSVNNPYGLQGICPDGWHIPSDAEWTQLTDYVSSCRYYSCSGDVDAIAKALADTNLWASSYIDGAVGNDLSANNATGFSARPAGIRIANTDYLYSQIGFGAHFWSSTDLNQEMDPRARPAIYRGIYSHSSIVGTGSTRKENACSVRCLRD